MEDNSRIDFMAEKITKLVPENDYAKFYQIVRENRIHEDQALRLYLISHDIQQLEFYARLMSEGIGYQHVLSKCIHAQMPLGIYEQGMSVKMLITLPDSLEQLSFYLIEIPKMLSIIEDITDVLVNLNEIATDSNSSLSEKEIAVAIKTVLNNAIKSDFIMAEKETEITLNLKEGDIQNEDNRSDQTRTTIQT